MRYFLLFIFITIFSCGKEKVILLPEINHSEISEITDVSAAYLFYDETQKDSVELNRKNLIISTNWLVNVDKRLTLNQVIPHIKFLQAKKSNSSHKNKNAKNYYTCNDTSIKNLGFVEFTDVNYNLFGCKPYEKDSLYVYNKTNFKTYKNPVIQQDSTVLEIPLFFDNDFFISTYDVVLKENQVKHYLNALLNSRDEQLINIVTSFNRNINFQDYINYKTFINTLKSEGISISNNEFIY